MKNTFSPIFKMYESPFDRIAFTQVLECITNGSSMAWKIYNSNLAMNLDSVIWHKLNDQLIVIENGDGEYLEFNVLASKLENKNTTNPHLGVETFTFIGIEEECFKFRYHLEVLNAPDEIADWYFNPTISTIEIVNLN